MNITADLVKELRERTSAGMMECKKALMETNGDIEAAIELMRKSGQAKAAKKAGRIAAEGVIAIKSTPENKTAIMLEVNSETDFAARDANFTHFVEQIISRALDNRTPDIETLLATTISVDSDRSIAQELTDLITKIGENINIRRLVLLKTVNTIVTYSHGGRIGVLVELSKPDLELGRDIAMHIAASKPEVIVPENISAATIDKEKEIFMAQAAQSGKPADILEKMVAGRIKKFLSEVSLVGQPFVKDPNITVGDLLKQKDVQILSFVRYEVGEGIEKQECDFAAEVMAQAEKIAHA
jgi:elongation factor Ts